MTPVSPVVPGAEAIEKVVGGNGYVPLPIFYLSNPYFPVMSRWRFTDEERQRIANGEDLVMTVLTFGGPLNPVHLQLVPQDGMPELVGDVDKT